MSHHEYEGSDGGLKSRAGNLRIFPWELEPCIFSQLHAHHPVLPSSDNSTHTRIVRERFRASSCREEESGGSLGGPNGRSLAISLGRISKIEISMYLRLMFELEEYH